jgi:hypothetical protein
MEQLSFTAVSHVRAKSQGLTDQERALGLLMAAQQHPAHYSLLFEVPITGW